RASYLVPDEVRSGLIHRRGIRGFDQRRRFRHCAFNRLAVNGHVYGRRQTEVGDADVRNLQPQVTIGGQQAGLEQSCQPDADRAYLLEVPVDRDRLETVCDLLARHGKQRLVLTRQATLTGAIERVANGEGLAQGLDGGLEDQTIGRDAVDITRAEAQRVLRQVAGFKDREG